MILKNPQAFPNCQRGVWHKEVSVSCGPNQPSGAPGMYRKRALPCLTTLTRVLVTRAPPLERQRSLPTLIWIQRAERMELGQKLLRTEQIRVWLGRRKLG